MKRLMVVVPLALTSLCRFAGGRSGSPLAGAWIGSYTLNGPGPGLARRRWWSRGRCARRRPCRRADRVGEGLRRAHPLPVAGPSGAARLRRTPREWAAGRSGGAGPRARDISCAPWHRTGTGRARPLRVGDGVQAVVDDPYGPARLVDLESGAVHGLYPAGRRLRSAQASRPVTGRRHRSVRCRGSEPRGKGRTASSACASSRCGFEAATRCSRGRSRCLPEPGRHPAVAFVHGSGSTQRAYLPELHALLVRNGVAVLAYDKRGIGQSGGGYPGESPTPDAIDILARDAAAAADSCGLSPRSIRRAWACRAQPGRLDHAAGWFT